MEPITEQSVDGESRVADGEAAPRSSSSSMPVGLREEVARQSDFPAAARAVARLQGLVGNETCSASAVAQVILQDAALAMRILQAVNSAFYGVSSRRVSTITRAVVMLGFETIRDVAASLLVLEHFVRKGASGPRLRAELRESLFRAWTAQALARRVDPALAEEAYLLGLFSNLGRVWLASHRPAEFERLVELEALGLAPEGAGPEVFGVRPEEIAGLLLERGGHPTTFLRFFREPPPHDAESLRTPGGTLAAVVHLAASLRHDGEGGGEATAGATAAGEFARLLGIPPAELSTLVPRAIEASRRHGRFLDVDDESPGPAHPHAVPRERRSEAAGHAAAVHGGSDVSTPTANRTLAIGSEIARAIVERADLGEVSTMALEGMSVTAPFDLALLFLANPARDRLIGRIGVGPGLTDELLHLTVPIEPGCGALAEAARSRSPVVLANARPADLVPPGIPPPRVLLRAALASPLVVHDRLVGVVLAGRTSARPPEETDQHVVRFFADLICVAIAARPT